MRGIMIRQSNITLRYTVPPHLFSRRLAHLHSDLMSSSSSECSDRSSPAASSDDSDGDSFAHSVHELPENALPPSAAPGSIAAMMAEETVAAAQPAVAGSLGAMFASDSDEEPPPNATCSEQRLSFASSAPWADSCSAPHRAQTATSRAAAASADDGDSDSDGSDNGKDSDDNEADGSGYDSDFGTDCGDNTRQRVTSLSQKARRFPRMLCRCSSLPVSACELRVNVPCCACILLQAHYAFTRTICQCGWLCRHV